MATTAKGTFYDFVPTMSGNEILSDWDYAAVKLTDSNRVVSVGDMFIKRDDAFRYCTEMNMFAEDEYDEYRVVGISHADTDGDLKLRVSLVTERIIEQMETLSERNVGAILRDMSRSEFLNYECDLAAHMELARVLSFMRGVFTDSCISIPEGPEFPSPEI